mgnify:FL=1
MQKFPYGYPEYDDLTPSYDIPTFVRTFSTRYETATAVSYRKTPSYKDAVCVSYRTFGEDIAALARALFQKGMKGAHIAVVGTASYDWVCLFFAIQSIGAVMVPLDREWGAEELNGAITAAECTYAFLDPELEEKLGGIDAKKFFMKREGERSVTSLIEEENRTGHSLDFPYAPDSFAMSLIAFTSGTTGKGKGVMLSQGGMLSDAFSGRRMILPYGKAIMTLPPHHTYGMTIGFLATFASGMNVYMSSGLRYITREMQVERPDLLVLVPLYVESFDAKIRAVIERKKLAGVVRRARRISSLLRKLHIDLRPFLFRKILAAFGGNLRIIIVGGAPLRPELVRTFDDYGVNIINGYGITECSPLVACNRDKLNTPGTVGFPLPCLSLKIADPDAEGNGEVRVKGENVMLGYYHMPKETADAFDSEGYFRTGDIGRLDGAGRLILSGRSKNLIILPNGKNVYPEEIETLLGAERGVAEVVVYEGIGKDDPTRHAIVAEIYPTEEFLPLSDEDLYAHFRRITDAYNSTAVSYRKIDLLRVRRTEFPKNTLRKIQRFKIDTSI